MMANIIIKKLKRCLLSRCIYFEMKPNGRYFWVWNMSSNIFSNLIKVFLALFVGLWYHQWQWWFDCVTHQSNEGSSRGEWNCWLVVINIMGCKFPWAFVSTNTGSKTGSGITAQMYRLIYSIYSDTYTFCFVLFWDDSTWHNTAQHTALHSIA